MIFMNPGFGQVLLGHGLHNLIMNHGFGTLLLGHGRHKVIMNPRSVKV